MGSDLSLQGSYDTGTTVGTMPVLAQVSHTVSVFKINKKVTWILTKLVNYPSDIPQGQSFGGLTACQTPVDKHIVYVINR